MRGNPMVRAVLVSMVLLLVIGVGSAEGVKKRIRFQRGSSSAVVSGTVVRGDQDEYYVGASGGQEMTVRISSVEDNAVFQIYKPNGKTLSGAGEGDDATNWSGTLPASGDYTIVVGGTRGNASYKLKISIE